MSGTDSRSVRGSDEQLLDIVVDFGGTNIKIGLVAGESIITKATLPAWSNNGVLPRLRAVKETIAALLAERGLRLADCSGIGVAMPGLVDFHTRKLVSVNAKYEDAVGFSFESWAKEEFGLPIVLENDARAAIVGETAYGTARGETDAVLMIFGTGIGTAAMMNGKAVRGKHHQAGVLGGHLATDVHGSECTCGNIGCLEAQSSHWALLEQVKRHPNFEWSALARAESLGYQTIVEQSRLGDEVAMDVFEHLLLHWSAGIVNLVHAYDPDCVILSGGLMKSADYFLPRLSANVCKRTWTPWGQVKFIVADDPDASVLLGLSALLHGNVHT